MTLPVVTIILPTYRRPRLLARALRSVLAQTRGDFVVMVCDNDSADETSEVVADFAARDPRVTYHCNEHNIGALANFSAAFARVETEYFCLLSDDDILLPRCLEIQARCLNEHPDAVAWGGIVLTLEGNEIVASKPSLRWPPGITNSSDALKLLAMNCRLETTGMLFRKRVIDAWFTDPPALIASNDIAWLLTSATKGAIGFSPEPTAFFSVHCHSYSSQASSSPEMANTLWMESAFKIAHCLASGHFGSDLVTEVNLRLQIIRCYGVTPMIIALERSSRLGKNDYSKALFSILRHHLSCRERCFFWTLSHSPSLVVRLLLFSLVVCRSLLRRWALLFGKSPTDIGWHVKLSDSQIDLCLVALKGYEE